MGKGKKRVISKQAQPLFHCSICNYKAPGERARKLHFKYSHNLKYNGKWKDNGRICGFCGKNIPECTCVSSNRRV